MSQPRMQRASFSLPPDLIEDLNYLCRRLGITKSALVSQLMAVPLRDLRGMIEQVPENPTEQDALRFRGASRELIQKRIASAQRLAEGDLFDGQ